MTSERSWGDPFEGDGEVRALGRATDWAATSLGPVEGWPEALRTVVRSALESPFPINLWCGPELVLIYNDAYRRVLGAKHPGALGRPGAQVWAEIWGEIAPMFEQIRAGGPPIYADDAPFVMRRAGEGEGSSSERTPNAWFTFSLSAVRDEEGGIVAFLNIVSESTGRVLAEREGEAARARAERAERRLLEVFAKAPAFMAVLRGADHVFEYVNAAYYQLVGYRELLGRPVFEALPEVRGQGFEELLDEVLETGETYVGREVPVVVSRTPDSEPEERFVDLVYYPISEPDGTHSGVVAHGSDVTEHVLGRLEAQRARYEAEQSNRAKSQFLANMSHELRTPINAIIGYTDLLQLGIAGSLTEQQLAQLDRIKSSSNHLLGLINEVLDLAKVESGQMEVRRDPVTVREPVRQALELVTPQAQQRNLQLAEEGDGASEVVALADEDRVRQILLNLLSNAVKFTEPGGSIRVRWGITDRPDAMARLKGDGPWVRIEVQDTGVGIPPEKLPTIFDPFVQVESGYTRSVGGTGLGLAISQRLAHMMNGELTARSTLGEGSCFALWIPAASATATPDQARSWPEAAHEVPGLSHVAQALGDCVDRIVREFGERLREEPIPGIQAMDQAHLLDHTATFLVDIALNLVALDEGGGEPSLMQDGNEIQRVISDRHGAQRARLGWSEEALEREFDVLRSIVDVTLRRRLSQRTDRSVEQALGILGRLLDQAERLSLRGFRRALEQASGES